jgi:hypothetical protein
MAAGQIKSVMVWRSWQARIFLTSANPTESVLANTIAESMQGRQKSLMAVAAMRRSWPLAVD